MKKGSKWTLIGTEDYGDSTSEGNVFSYHFFKSLTSEIDCGFLPKL